MSRLLRVEGQDSLEMPIRTVLTVLGVLACCASTACGGSGGEDASTVPGGADPADVRVIDRWAKLLDEGDVDGAARLFAIPSVAENGLVLHIDSFVEARLFNAALPCGASLIEAVPRGGITVATFELDERPGPGACGDGVGAEARTAFRIEAGRIVEWRRLPAAGGGSGVEPAPSSSA